MVEEATNLVLEHLRAIRSDVYEIKTVQQKHGHRLTRLEIGISALRRDQASEVEHVARPGARMDQLAEEVSRIKRRLDIID